MDQDAWIDGGALAGGVADGDQPAVEPQHVEAFLERFTTHGFEDDVDPRSLGELPDLLHEVALDVVDGRDRAERDNLSGT